MFSFFQSNRSKNVRLPTSIREHFLWRKICLLSIISDNIERAAYSPTDNEKLAGLGMVLRAETRRALPSHTYAGSSCEVHSLTTDETYLTNPLVYIASIIFCGPDKK